MDIEEFRKRGHETIDRICKYYQELDSYDVLPKVEPGYLKKLLPQEAPEDPESFDAIQSDMESKIIPGVTHWQSPNFFAFYPASSSFPTILADMYSDMLNCIGFNVSSLSSPLLCCAIAFFTHLIMICRKWICSPACTELETIVLDWLAKLIGLHSDFLSEGKGGGVIQSSASEATLVTLLAARQRLLNKYKAQGLSEDELYELSTRLIAYGSEQTHSRLEKASMIANTRFRIIPTGRNFSIRGETVMLEIENDVMNGLIPFYIVTTVGTTSSAVNSISDIANAIEGTSVWLHVDAAHAGSALVCPEYRHYLDGINRSDSFDFNMHEWLLTNFDASCLWVRNRKYLNDALSVKPEFLRNPASESGLVLDYRDWEIPVGRRFRSLKIWFVLRSYGAKGLREHVRKAVKLAQRFFHGILRHPDLFAISAQPAFSLVCFHVKSNPDTPYSSNQLTSKVYDRANETRQIYLSRTVLHDQEVIRFAVGSPWTTEEHIDKALELLVKITRDVVRA
ncbi:8267_t:CDS:2 [Acaulospora morrowiae]|uniref:8267_t:CDS:1 n=1 Tax=Acaulospora morrowiae TaxID=94023 RepID=A0A9N9ALP1_9GLOM|nr:8267_t:CDS:2 [Acaulospora morrowiae]